MSHCLHVPSCSLRRFTILFQVARRCRVRPAGLGLPLLSRTRGRARSAFMCMQQKAARPLSAPPRDVAVRRITAAEEGGAAAQATVGGPRPNRAWRTASVSTRPRRRPCIRAGVLCRASVAHSCSSRSSTVSLRWGCGRGGLTSSAPLVGNELLQPLDAGACEHEHLMVVGVVDRRAAVLGARPMKRSCSSSSSTMSNSATRAMAWTKLMAATVSETACWRARRGARHRSASPCRRGL